MKAREMAEITVATASAAEPASPLRGFGGPDQPRDDILQRCIRCGFCLPTCPTYVETMRESSSPRGRIHLIAQVAEGRLDLLDPGFVEQMYQCLDCRACEAVCPSGVEYGQLVETARTQVERAASRPLDQRILRVAAFDGLLADLERFRLASTLLRAYQRSGLRRLARQSGLLNLLRLRETEALLPDLPAAFVVPSGQVYPLMERASRRGRVALLAGCAMSTVFAPTDRATIRVLTRNGYEVVLSAGQQCCGALTVHSGEMDRARMLACRNILAFETSDAEYVVANAAGCGAALKEYGRIFADEPAWRERAAAFSARVRDVTELLGDLHAAGELDTAFLPLPLRVTYQEACHLAHAQRISRQPRELLRAIPHLELVEMEEPALCCGSAGVYNLTRPAMANRLGGRKVRHIAATRAQVVVTANPGCALHLRGQLRRASSPARVAHIVDVLDAAYRGQSI
jgi:glycolate oxidase iron-sulfur subunit